MMANDKVHSNSTIQLNDYQLYTLLFFVILNVPILTMYYVIVNILNYI